MATKKVAPKKVTKPAPTPKKVPAKKKAQSFAPPELDFDEDLDDADPEEDDVVEDAYDEDEDEEEDDYEEYDEEEADEDEPPPPRRRSRESRKAPRRGRPIKRVNMADFDSDPDDPTDRVPDFHGGQDIFTRTNSKVIEVVATQTGYDNFQLREEGEGFEIRVLYAKDEEGKQTKKFQRGGVGGIPPWCVLKHEYKPREVDLPGTALAKGRRRKRVPSVRGGATGMREL